MKRFLREADEIGYDVTSWLATPRSGATTQEDFPVTSVTFLLQPSATAENFTSHQV